MTDNLKILLHDEVQLIDFGESRAIGPWIKLRLADIEQLAIFRGLDTATAKKTGHIFNVTLSQGDIIAEDTRTGEEKQASAIRVMDEWCGKFNASTRQYGDEARQLAQSSFFRRPEVWAAVGSDLTFQAWVISQPCIICGDGDWVNGERYCEPAHVRRSDESGTAFKADYACVPMCNAHHIGIQHQHGETQAYRTYLMNKKGHEQLVTLPQAKDWFDKKRIETVFQWCWETIKAELGYDSWAEVPPPKLLLWATAHDVAGKDGMWMPRCYYDDYPDPPPKVRFEV